MKVVAGKFDGDSDSDLGILHQLADGGIGVHVLQGSAGTPFQNTVTSATQLPGSDGWDWTKVKPGSGFFNTDGYEDVVLLSDLTDGSVNVHVLWGSSSPFSGSPMLARNLPASDWSWSQLKVAARSAN